MVDLNIIEAEVDNSIRHYGGVALMQCSYVKELITRLRKAEKDAERYRWLRNCDTVQTERLVENGHIVGFGVLDAMIDEALQAINNQK